MAKFKDAEHLFRLAGLFVVGLLLFLLLRWVFIPKGFGKYGHYRAEALAEISSKPIVYAGHKACKECHTDVVDVKKAGKHAHVNCEGCHGPQEQHVLDPASVVPELPDTASLCPRCHEANLAKPQKFPQVKSSEHSMDQPCKTCHTPHSPAIGSGEKAS